MWIEQVRQVGNLTEVNAEKLMNMDRWILSRMSDMVERVNAAIENYDFNIATGCLKSFLYYDFCDVYLVSFKLFALTFRFLCMYYTSYNQQRHCFCYFSKLALI